MCGLVFFCLIHHKLGTGKNKTKHRTWVLCLAVSSRSSAVQEPSVPVTSAKERGNAVPVSFPASTSLFSASFDLLLFFYFF